MPDFRNFDILTFDCYGTLIDWERGILSALRPLMGQHRVTITDADLLSHYARYESEIEAGGYRPYREVLREVVRRFAADFSFTPDKAELDCLGDSIRHWPPFEDTVQALKELKSRFMLAIVSNIDNDLFAGSQELLKVDFDFVVTAAQVKAYKPSHAVFEYALKTIGVPKERVLHVAQSLYHDHVPARALGINSVWINRRSSVSGSGATPPADIEVALSYPDLASFAKAVGLP